MPIAKLDLASLPPFDPQPVTLEGTHVRLEPMTMAHAEGLHTASRDPELYRYLPRPQPQTPAETRAWLAEVLAAAQAGTVVPFATIHRASGAVAGSTQYLDITRKHRGLEIGATWISPAYQRTAVNTEAKYLMLRHAFERLGAIRVWLKTDSRNLRSQQAIERLGAQREGTLRHHMLLFDGTVRDTVFYSIIPAEWPAVRERLEAALAGR
ncbi:MAG: GNAT family N-acetyltransferase [Candidatus Lambdaproteobacteria bacterium]|nr:GNAT family N-acetyltransferase [Candidatus Lambdaproteobacteria bacterium]